MVSIIILYYNLMGPPSYMRSVVDRNVIMRCMTVLKTDTIRHLLQIQFLNCTCRHKNTFIWQNTRNWHVWCHSYSHKQFSTNQYHVKDSNNCHITEEKYIIPWTEEKYIIPWHIRSSRSIFHFAKASMRLNSCSMSKQLWPKEGTIAGDMTIWNSFMLQIQIHTIKIM